MLSYLSNLEPWIFWLVVTHLWNYRSVVRSTLLSAPVVSANTWWEREGEKWTPLCTWQTVQSLMGCVCVRAIPSWPWERLAHVLKSRIQITFIFILRATGIINGYKMSQLQCLTWWPSVTVNLQAGCTVGVGKAFPYSSGMWECFIEMSNWKRGLERLSASFTNTDLSSWTVWCFLMSRAEEGGRDLAWFTWSRAFILQHKVCVYMQYFCTRGSILYLKVLKLSVHWCIGGSFG